MSPEEFAKRAQRVRDALDHITHKGEEKVSSRHLEAALAAIDKAFPAEQCAPVSDEREAHRAATYIGMDSRHVHITPRPTKLSGRGLACNQREAVQRISERRAFKAAALSGEWTRWPSTGRLPQPWSGLCVLAAAASEDGAFVVYSYATPIAWWADGLGWQIPDARYSVTTSKHQSIVRRAVAQS